MSGDLTQAEVWGYIVVLALVGLVIWLWQVNVVLGERIESLEARLKRLEQGSPPLEERG